MFTLTDTVSRLRFAGPAALLCGLATFATAQTVTIKSITPIPILPKGITTSGDVVGARISNPGPAIYSQGSLVSLSLPPGAYPVAINDAWQVAGQLSISYGVEHAFLYDAGVIRDLGTLGGQSSYAVSINASGEVAGYAAIPIGYIPHAFLYSGGVMRDLGTLGGPGSFGSAINDAGDVVGVSYVTVNISHAFLYSHGVMHDLGALQPGLQSQAAAINATGHIAGMAESIPGSYTYDHLFIYANGTMTDLGGPSGAQIVVTGINGSDQIVGQISQRTPAGYVVYFAFLYTPATGIVDLNSLLPPNSGWVLPVANAINDAGQIVGSGYYLGQNSGFLLSIDTGSSPVTSATISGPTGNNGWYLGSVSVTLSASTRNNSVSATYFSVDGAAYQRYGGPFPVAGDGIHQVSYYSIDTAGSQETAIHQTIRIDAGKPVSHVAALPATAATPSFSVSWSGSDPISGIASYTIFVADNGGAFAPWVSGTTATQATYSGVAGHTYGFYSMATDVAGNLELAKISPEAVTTVPIRPVSHVTPLPPNAPGASFPVQWSGSAPGVGIRNYTIYASDNGGAFTPWLSGTPSTQATYSGVCEHNYGFYSIATDNNGLQEIAKTIAEGTTRVPFTPVSHVLALPAMAPSPNFNVQWSGINTCTPIGTWDIYVSDNGGPFTIWRTRTSATQAYFSGALGHTYGFYSIAFDNGGSTEAPKGGADATIQTPVAMAADVNSDGRIDCTDVSIVKAAMGTRTGQVGFNPRADVNADGVVDVRDLAIVTQKLVPGATCP